MTLDVDGTPVKTALYRSYKATEMAGKPIKITNTGETPVQAVVSVSGPGRWHYRGTKPMRRVHFAIEYRLGRLFARTFLDTRISSGRWDPVPVPPADAAAKIAPTPLLIVHGDQDAFFPVDHAEQLYAAANDPRELWIVPGFGHAEAAAKPALLDRIGGWLLAKSAAVAAAKPPGCDREFYAAKVRTAAFYAAHVIPVALGLARVIDGGAASVVETDAALI